MIKKETFWLYGLLIFGFFSRILYIFYFTKPESYLWSDAGGYDGRALEMAKGQFVNLSTNFPPFYHIFLSLIYRPILWLSLESWRIKIYVVISALLYMLAFWCIYQIAKKLFSVKTALIILAVLVLWYPFVFLNYLVMSENLFFPLIFLGLYILITKPQNWPAGLLIGIVWGLAFITRPIFALAFPLFFFWALYYKINWKFLLNLTLTVVLITGSMMLFNFYYTNGQQKSVSSNGGVGFAMLWCDLKSVQYTNGSYYYWFAPPARENYPDSKRIYTSVPFENQKYYYKMGLDCIKNNPQRIITNFSSVANLLNSQLFPTIPNIAFWQELRTIFKVLTAILFFGALVSVIGMATNHIRTGENKKYFYLFGLIILSLLATVYLQNTGEERYIIPYVPLLIILCTPLLQNRSQL